MFECACLESLGHRCWGMSIHCSVYVLVTSRLGRDVRESTELTLPVCCGVFTVKLLRLICVWFRDTLMRWLERWRWRMSNRSKCALSAHHIRVFSPVAW
eukprot:1191515-Prorocentrum_minimum.AAC.1